MSLDTKQPPSAENEREYLKSIIKHLDGKLEKTKKQLVVKEKEVDIMKLWVGSILYEGDQEYKRIELGKMKWEWCSLIYSKKK